MNLSKVTNTSPEIFYEAVSHKKKVIYDYIQTKNTILYIHHPQYSKYIMQNTVDITYIDTIYIKNTFAEYPPERRGLGLD